MDAARHWARGGGGDMTELAADLRAAGAPEAEIETVVGSATCAVWPENQEIVGLFVACGTQWRYAGMEAVPVGLDYAGVGAAAAATGTTLDASRFADLRVMEAAALEELHRQREARRG